MDSTSQWLARFLNGGGLVGVWERCNFSIKITHFYAYFGPNSHFKAISYQLKAFKTSLLNILNRINNEVQVL